MRPPQSLELATTCRSLEESGARNEEDDKALDYQEFGTHGVCIARDTQVEGPDPAHAL